MTGFTNSEEQANGTTEYMPYLLEDEFISNGAHFKKRLTGVICSRRWSHCHRSKPNQDMQLLKML